MRLNCRPSRWVRRERRISIRKYWHNWFAWHPVSVEEGECRWLEVVERYGTICYGSSWFGGAYWNWVYRAKEAK